MYKMKLSCSQKADFIKHTEIYSRISSQEKLQTLYIIHIKAVEEDERSMVAWIHHCINHNIQCNFLNYSIL